MILGLETSTTICSTGLADSGRVLAEISFDVKNLHDQVLTEAVAQLLRLTGLSLDQVDALAVSAGPGSFTGLRIGMSVAKGLAFSCGKPLILVGTLLLQAAAVLPHAQVHRARAMLQPVMKARLGEVYTAVFAAAAPLPIQKAPVQAFALADFPAAARKHAFLCGNGLRQLREAGMLARLPKCFLVPEEDALLSGGLVARLGEVLYTRGEVAEEACEPFYVQDFAVGEPKVVAVPPAEPGGRGRKS